MRQDAGRHGKRCCAAIELANRARPAKGGASAGHAAVSLKSWAKPRHWVAAATARGGRRPPSDHERDRSTHSCHSEEAEDKQPPTPAVLRLSRLLEQLRQFRDDLLDRLGLLG